MTLEQLIRIAETDPATEEYIAYTHARGWGLIKTRYWHTDYAWPKEITAERRKELQAVYRTEQALIDHGYLRPAKRRLMKVRDATIRRLERQLKKQQETQVHYGRKET